MSNTGESRKRLVALMRTLAMAALFVFLTAPANVAPATAAETTKSTAMLGVFFQNDNEGYEPTGDAERARITALEAQFKSILEASGHYKFVQMTPEVHAKIQSGQAVGACGGCEIEYGKTLGANTIAWVQVRRSRISS